MMNTWQVRLMKSNLQLRIKSVLLIFACILLNACISQTYEGRVIKVADGDSITMLHQGKELHIRLAEVDAPEHGQPYWKKSKQALQDYVLNKNILVEEFDVDQYDRLVGHVYVDDLWVNGELVRQGYAYVYTDFAVSAKLYKYEKAAENNRLGIWKLPSQERMKPWIWRKKN